ncbi:MAG: phosphatidylglycerol lysyltransferase domain-containing protein [Candidatus Babeliales bacterium]|nr:phosphatidylglycerol lysyltransferase domain-containing protein [Candidatus Babeliales bacterium]
METLTKAEFVQKWGHPTSVGIFDQACRIFSAPEINGIIGYRWQSKNAIVIGDPICPPQDLLKLITAFSDYCTAHSKNIIFLATSDHFTHWALEHNLFARSIEIGSEIIINPTDNILEGIGKNSSRLRNKYNLALRDGLLVKEYNEYDPIIEQKIKQVTCLWHKNRKGPQIYLSDLSILSDRAYKRYFYAEQHGKMLGVLVLNRIDNYNGWFINILMLIPDAHNSTSEFIILKMLEFLRNENCKHLSIGINSTNKLGQLYGFNRLTSWAARKTYYLISTLFQLNNRERYWKKFNPSKKPAFLLFTRPLLRLREVLDILDAVNVRKNKKNMY